MIRVLGGPTAKPVNRPPTYVDKEIMAPTDVGVFVMPLRHQTTFLPTTPLPVLPMRVALVSRRMPLLAPLITMYAVTVPLFILVVVPVQLIILARLPPVLVSLVLIIVAGV